MDAAPNARPSFREKAAGPLRAEGIGIFQINLGYRCNLSCRHCHVNGGPLGRR